MLVQRRRRWTNIEPTLGQCIVLVQSVNMCVCLPGYRGFVPRSGIQISKKQINVSSPLTHKDSVLWGGGLCYRKVACSASDRQESNFETCG